MSPPFRRTTFLRWLLVLTPIVMMHGCATPGAPGTPESPRSTAATSRSSSAPADRVITLTRRGGFAFASVRINGRDAGYFLVDTGASLAIIDTTLAHELALPRTGETMATGIGGVLRLPNYTMQSFTADAVALDTRTAAAMDLAFLSEATGLRVRGVIGYHCLAVQPFTFDHRAGRITLHDPATFTPPDGAAMSQLRLIENIPAVPATFEGYGSLWLQIDTGANAHLMMPSATAERWPTLITERQGQLSSSRGVGDAIKVIRVAVPGVRLLETSLRNVPCDVEWTNRQGEYRGALVGRVGNGVLGGFRLTFDPARHVLYSTWNPAP